MLGTPLFLDPALEAEARNEARAARIARSFADTLSDLYPSIVKMLEDGIAPDGAAITVKSGSSGRLMTWGGEAAPFALVADKEVWVASRYVVECVPPSRKSDGRGIAGAMRKLRWSSVEDRRTGYKMRGICSQKLDAGWKSGIPLRVCIHKGEMPAFGEAFRNLLLGWNMAGFDPKRRPR